MATALYDPEDGYYARPIGQVGRAGDFFTSVSVGNLFGRLLALHIAAWHRDCGAPRPWRIIETGANDGALAADILVALRDLDADAGLEYAIVEPLPRLAEAQHRRVPQARIVNSAAALAERPLPSFVFGNEVIDALPFHRIESDGQGWTELGVGVDPAGEFIWTPIGPAPMQEWLPDLRPPGYRTEIRSAVANFLSPLATAMAGGRMLWIDYGYEWDDYYHESRTTGTLRTFFRHQAGENPLETPGLVDISAHVDFTSLARELRSLGAKVIRFETQASFLTGIARPWLMEMDGRTDAAARKELRAFQTLTHPAHLGTRFKVMEAELV
jgi:SAM-dependent MidA family methyltransferase